MNREAKVNTKCDFCPEKDFYKIHKGGWVGSKWACYDCEDKETNHGLFSVSRTLEEADNEDHGKIHEQLEKHEIRIKKIEDKNKEDSKKQQKQDLWNKSMLKIIFYGAVASGTVAICQLVQFIMNFFKK